MKNIIMLAGANIRKSKSQAISLLLFVLIAAMFLNIGLVLFINYGKAFDQRAEQLHAPHAGFLQAAGFTKDQQLSYLKQYPGSVEVEKQPVISALGDYYMNDLKAVAYLIIANAAWGQEMNPPSFIGESRPLDDHSIYVPYLIKTAGGYELGDHYRLNLSGTELNFTIAGFTEEIMFGSAMNNIYRFYVSNAAFENLEQRFPELQCYLQSVRMEESGLGTQIWQDYLKEFVYSNENTSSLYVIPVNYDDIKSSRVIIPTITALIVVAFAAILLAVSLIVIRFRIVNSIEEDMTNIGILKAVGYKNNQIISSILMQFGGITLIGGLSGIAASQLILPLLSRVLEAQSALIWNPGFDFIFAAITLFFVLLSIALVSFMTAKRIYKLHPLIALRGGLETHNFKKNRISLDQSYGGLSFLMAMKHLVQNKKQAVMIAIIMTAVSFASIVGLAMYYNIGVDLDSFVTIITGEKPDASLILKDPNDTQRILEKLQKNQRYARHSVTIL